MYIHMSAFRDGTNSLLSVVYLREVMKEYDLMQHRYVRPWHRVTAVSWFNIIHTAFHSILFIHGYFATSFLPCLHTLLPSPVAFWVECFSNHSLLWISGLFHFC